jgi:hypothetical protein
MSDEQKPGSGGSNVFDLNQERKRKQEISKSQLEDELRRRNRIVEELNKEWCVVVDHGAGWVIQEIDNSLRKGFSNIFRVTEKDFKLAYKHKRFSMNLPTGEGDKTKRVTKSWADWWLEDPRRRTYFEVDFAPQRKLPPRIYNLWKGFAVEPVRPRRGVASWDLLQDHLFRVVCSGNFDWYDYLLNWLAEMVQKPDQPSQTVPVLRGGEGHGKNIFASYLLAIFGPHGLYLSDIQQLLGHFNVHLQNCVFVLADEAGYYPGDKAREGVLRALITEPRLPIEPKFAHLYQAPNCLHPMIFSNHVWVFPMAPDARRPFVLHVPDTRKDDVEYFKALNHERDHLQGPSAMLWDLLRRDITHFNVRQVPDTPAGREQKRLSLKSVEQYWLTVLDREYAYRSRYGVRSLSRWPESEVYTNEILWNGYMQFCDDGRRHQRQTDVELGIFLNKLYPFARSRTPLPTHEIQTPLSWAKPGGGRDSTQLRLYDEPEAGVEPYWLPDDDAHVVICQPHKRGRRVGSIEEARARFDEVMGNLDPPWRES